MPHVCVSVWQCVYGYQTLIAGVLAIVAAGIAAWVAWGQLRRMTVQANVVISNLVKEQVGRVARSRGWLMSRVRKFDLEVRRRLDQFDTFDNGSVNVHWAHDYSVQADQLSDELEKHREEQRLPDSVDAGVGAVLVRLRALTRALDAIHRPASTDQHDEDHSYTDEEWQKVHEDAAEAEGQVSSLAADLLSAIDAMEAAYNAELKLLRDRSQRVDKMIVDQ